MSLAMMFAFGCYLGAALLSLGAGVVYLVRREFMPYHGVAAGLAWQHLAPGMQVLLLALLRGVGSGFMVVGLAIVLLLVYPFRAGESWALWAIPAVGLTMGVPTLAGVYVIRSRTHARPPWGLALFTVSLILAGAGVTLAASLL